MFFDNQILNSTSLKNAWRAGNNQELSPEDVPLPRVCTRLDSWIASDYKDPCRRLSLRTSSILVDGAAKLYKQGLNDLIQDVYKLEYRMITRKRPRDISTDESNLISDSNTEELEYSNSNNISPRRSSVVTPASFNEQNGGKSEKNIANSQSSRFKKIKNNNVQAVSLKSRRTERDTRRTNEDDLPIGQILIYESLESRVPSKIIVGKINPRIKKNIIF